MKAIWAALFWAMNSCVWAVGPMDSYNSLVAGGTMPGFKDGLFATARFSRPEGLAFDEKSRCLFVADHDNHRIRVIDLSHDNQVSTLAGGDGSGSQDGSFEQASFDGPSRLALLPADRLAVYDRGTHSIRLLDLKARQTSTLLKDVEAWDMAYRSTDNDLYWTDPDKGLLVYMNLQQGQPVTVLSKNKELPSPYCLYSHLGHLYVSDRASSRVYAFDSIGFSAPQKPMPTLDKIGQGSHIVALAESDGAVYALQSDKLPLVKFVQGKSQAVSLATVWGFLVDPDHQKGFENLLDAPSDHPTGFLSSDSFKRKFFMSAAAQARNGVLSVKDYDFGTFWLSSSEPGGDQADDFTYPSEKPEGVYRILLTGDSRTYIAPAAAPDSDQGTEWFYGAPRTATMGKQLELMLNTEAALKGTKTRFEVLEWNRKGMALSTYAPYELPRLVKKYRIDLVLALTGHTGFQDYFMKPMKDGIPVQDVDPEYLLKPLSERVPAGAAADLYARYKKKVPTDTEKEAFPGADRSDWGFSIWQDPQMKDDLMEMAGRRLQVLEEGMRTMESGDWHPHLVLFFVPFRPWPDFIQPFWKELAAAHHWSFLDLTEPYEALRVSYFPAATDCCDGHYTAYSSYLIGSLLARSLIDQKMVPFESVK